MIASLLLAAQTASAQLPARVSVDASGAQANDWSVQPSMSANGNLIAFHSRASNLVSNDTNADIDVFVHDRTAGTTSRVSISAAGVQGNGASSEAQISADGRFVAYKSTASNLVPGDSSGADIFIHDRQTLQVVRASNPVVGANASEVSEQPSISADGRFVAFRSAANNLVTGDNNGFEDIFVYDRLTAQTSRENVATGGTEGDSASAWPAISGDGRFVAFYSGSTNLVPGDFWGAGDIFVRDRVNQTTRRISVTPAGVEGNAESKWPAISADGRKVSFYTLATNLVSIGPAGSNCTMVADLQSGQIACASVTLTGGTAPTESERASLSADGRFIAFTGLTGNLVPGGGVGTFVRDMMLGVTTRVSVNANGIGANGLSSWPRIDGSGRLVAFQSLASNLVPNDTNSASDVFVGDTWVPCYQDSDNDGYGSGIGVPTPPPGCGTGTSLNSFDCDDSNATVYPGAPEFCDGLDNDCNGTVDVGFISTYCTAGTTVQGCVPSIGGEGAPSSISGSGFDIVVSDVPTQRVGLIFYGLSPTGQSWGLGSSSYLCIFYPVLRTGAHNSGGSVGACDGQLRVDFNAFMAAYPAALGSPFTGGGVFYAQGWFRDPGAAKQTNLSDGLRFTLCN